MLSPRQLANAIRALSMDAVQRANSGHPGMPMGMADIAEVLWNKFLIHNPGDPKWLNRDRFILSNGHGSMLLYSLLHLSGYDLTIDDLKNFRQLGSKTPGHPEFGITPGVETTTGPLGQGLTNAVGMAIAEQNLSQNFNKENFDIIDHFTYVFLGDGCLMEGISHEACSLAGTLGLGKLIAFWDDNGISIDGKVDGWFTDDTPKRFEAYDWHVVANIDGHNPNEVAKAIEQARSETNKPTLICCKTTIGYGSPNLAGSAKTHGAPLGDDELAKSKQNINWHHEPFTIPQEIYKAFDAKETGAHHQAIWQEKFQAYQQTHHELSAELLRRFKGELPDALTNEFNNLIEQLNQDCPKVATRKASHMVLDRIGKLLPEFMGGSADLTGSNLTEHSHSKVITKEDTSGNYIHYGVREFAMSAIMNGIAVHGGFIPYGGTFLTFLDYARNAVRLSALMNLRVVYVFTHDSIGLGEDGPTHQPIEHLAMLRLTPNISLWRPCDALETVIAWQQALANSNKPTCLALSRQSVMSHTRTGAQISNIEKGGYVLCEPKDNPENIILATGSEVEIAIQAAKKLNEGGTNTRVVSMPCVDTFLSQSQKYREQVLPSDVVNRVIIEAGASACWHQFAGPKGIILGIDQFGESAPAKDIYNKLGLTAPRLIEVVKSFEN